MQLYINQAEVKVLQEDLLNGFSVQDFSTLITYGNPRLFPGALEPNTSYATPARADALKLGIQIPYLWAVGRSFRSKLRHDLALAEHREIASVLQYVIPNSVVSIRVMGCIDVTAGYVSLFKLEDTTGSPITLIQETSGGFVDEAFTTWSGSPQGQETTAQNFKRFCVSMAWHVPANVSGVRKLTLTGKGSGRCLNNIAMMAG